MQGRLGAFRAPVWSARQSIPHVAKVDIAPAELDRLARMACLAAGGERVRGQVVQIVSWMEQLQTAEVDSLPPTHSPLQVRAPTVYWRLTRAMSPPLVHSTCCQRTRSS
jgi:hypothetical protein